MVRSHPQHKCSKRILFHACRAARAMSSADSAEDAGTAAAADDRAFSADLGDGQREERDAAAATPQTASGTAAALASEDAQHVKGGASSVAEPTAGGRDAADAVDPGKKMLEEIMMLKQKQKEAREAKMAAQKQLRNAERRRKRLKQRAKQLSDADLLAVISLRNHEKNLGQRVSKPDEEDNEDAESIPDDPGAGPSSGSTPKTASKPSSKKQRCG